MNYNPTYENKENANGARISTNGYCTGQKQAPTLDALGDNNPYCVEESTVRIGSKLQDAAEN